MSEASQTKKYFDLHLSGLGYLSRVREVTSSGRAKAKPFLACSIAAFHGDPNVENGIVYLNLDLIVSGIKAKEAIALVTADANDRDTKVLVGFRAGDHYISTYEIKKGDRAGQMGTVLKGRLLKVFWIKVNGELVYQDEQEDDRSAVEATDRFEIEHSGDLGTADADAATTHSDPPSQSTSVRDGESNERRASGFLRRSVRRGVRAGVRTAAVST
ncbi:hypothetical protein C9I57_26530 [Trinickia symbiotica]|uniref:DUF3577 domain-containing protein n=1 Tax=Trinickia symbiotica TaxID=863227 RepID=A0A2T3XMP5_9BURK|nr:DUF3577 domain-containing protein [Trinickia symbiotica]PTB17776.1 hypothetical protein C9I57_26530 [Trinickia symbiotica]